MRAHTQSHTDKTQVKKKTNKIYERKKKTLDFFIMKQTMRLALLKVIISHSFTLQNGIVRSLETKSVSCKKKTLSQTIDSIKIVKITIQRTVVLRSLITCELWYVVDTLPMRRHKWKKQKSREQQQITLHVFVIESSPIVKIANLFDVLVWIKWIGVLENENYTKLFVWLMQRVEMSQIWFRWFPIVSFHRKIDKHIKWLKKMKKEADGKEKKNEIANCWAYQTIQLSVETVIKWLW